MPQLPASRPPAPLQEPMAIGPSEEEAYFLKQSYENVITGIDHLDTLARHLMTATASVAGVLLTAVQIVRTTPAEDTSVWLLVGFGCWAATIGLAMWVLLPKRVAHAQAAPAEIRAAFEAIRSSKWKRLATAVAMFLLGLFSAMVGVL